MQAGGCRHVIVAILAGVPPSGGPWQFAADTA